MRESKQVLLILKKRMKELYNTFEWKEMGDYGRGYHRGIKGAIGFVDIALRGVSKWDKLDQED